MGMELNARAHGESVMLRHLRASAWPETEDRGGCSHAWGYPHSSWLCECDC